MIWATSNCKNVLSLVNDAVELVPELDELVLVVLLAACASAFVAADVPSTCIIGFLLNRRRRLKSAGPTRFAIGRLVCGGPAAAGDRRRTIVADAANVARPNLRPVDFAGVPRPRPIC